MKCLLRFLKKLFGIKPSERSVPRHTGPNVGNYRSSLPDQEPPVEDKGSDIVGPRPDDR